MELAEGTILQYPIEKCSASHISLVGSRVEVLTVNHAKFIGQIYSMDPISGSLFMMLERSSQEERNIKLVIGTSIKCIKILKKTNVNARSLCEESNSTPVPSSNYQRIEDLKNLKDSLTRWFNESHIPVAENNQGYLLVLNEVVVAPPYKPENCSGTNEVILWRVQKLLENFYQQ